MPSNNVHIVIYDDTWYVACAQTVRLFLFCFFKNSILKVYLVFILFFSSVSRAFTWVLDAWFMKTTTFVVAMKNVLSFPAAYFLRFTTYGISGNLSKWTGLMDGFFGGLILNPFD